MTVTVDFAQARMLRDLAYFRAPLGSKLKEKQALRRDVQLHAQICRLGSILFCSACTKVVGYGDLDGDTLLDPAAGWVLERRVEVGRGIMCGGGVRETCQHCHATESGCQPYIHHEHPLACSDDCEKALLVDKRFEHCEPPFGYQRGGPHP